uniref:Uncharacterized protein n=1 Tax=Panagrolaimus superbus TaxID=310955 RepID=A0A914ZCG8_9BILA
MIPFGGPNHRQCFYNFAVKCFIETFQDDSAFTTTWAEVYMMKEKMDIDWDPLINVQFTTPFLTYFNQCSKVKFNKLLKPNTMEPSLKETIELGKMPKNISIPFGSEIKLRYQQNVYSRVQTCLRSIPCFIKIHHQIIANIIEDCSNESFENLNILLNEFYESEKSVAIEKPSENS